MILYKGNWVPDNTNIQQSINPKLNKATTAPVIPVINPAANYKPNQFTSSQLAQMPMQASPSMMQAYQAKMQGYGIQPQPFMQPMNSNGAPVKGGK